MRECMKALSCISLLMYALFRRTLYYLMKVDLGVLTAGHIYESPNKVKQKDIVMFCHTTL